MTDEKGPIQVCSRQSLFYSVEAVQCLSSYLFEKARTGVSLMQTYIQRVLCLILIRVKNNRRARPRKEITTQRIPSLGPPRFAFPGRPAGVRLQTVRLGRSHDLGLHLLTIVHLF